VPAALGVGKNLPVTEQQDGCHELSSAADKDMEPIVCQIRAAVVLLT
jgi:hypothetical protein